MTEQEYIDCRNLAKVRDIKTILSDIIVANQDEIQFSDYHDVVQIIDMWEDRINESIKVTE